MSRQYLAIITVADGHTFNDLRVEAGSFIHGTPAWVEAFKISEALALTVVRRPPEKGDES